jgi:hypothetical protein
MKICDNEHEEIAFEGNWNTECPFCNKIKQNKKLEEEIEELKYEIKDKIDEIIGLERELNDN